VPNLFALNGMSVYRESQKLASSCGPFPMSSSTAACSKASHISHVHELLKFNPSTSTSYRVVFTGKQSVSKHLNPLCCQR